MYFKGLWDEERTLNEIRYYKMNNQICLINQTLIENELKYIKSYEVKKMRTNQESLEKFYIQSLDNDIIEYLAENKKIDIRLAMDIYYRSLLCKQIHNGENGIQYLDYKYLAEDLIENEKELFKSN